ncbi:cytochrome aa3 quinol oxidase subunit IV [Metabacillus sp. GX 13764]|uniref:cytochrome aa3 quinol oxidase subunit IV n=1 Tax=Metabacillus kandeliae TaxID=2900151 RepID=UPI001E4523CD|nr:cytochrome aa3 quinol oxidase subunit IV [Metabacillus kandeliae]MCD7034755.1 cytochrome aa3 quinol oxidase subunit IV [Metabacillus kandeliae]
MATNKTAAASHDHFPWNHVIGFALSIIFTLVALWVGLSTDLSTTAKLVIIFVFAFFQAAVQLIMFMHVTESDTGRWQVVTMVFSAFIALAFVLGSVWITMGHSKHMENMNHDQHKMENMDK